VPGKIKLRPLYFPVFLLQPIGTHGFATLNTTLYYREHTSLTVALFAFGPRWEFCLRAVGAFGLRAISLVARRAFITGEFTFSVGCLPPSRAVNTSPPIPPFGGSPGLLLQVNFCDG